MPSLTVEAIKDAISKLPAAKKSSLACWLNVQAMDQWDRQMQRDFALGGRGMAFLKKARKQASAAASRPMAEGFEERRGRRP
jgi:hypothetical protein